MITNTEIKAIAPSGYLGHAGEIWFARVFPPPFEMATLDYSLVFTTPYVLTNQETQRELIFSVEKDWLAYFQRNLPKTSEDTEVLAYEHLMKYGLDRNYWNEYVFLSYRNHQSDMILLEGIPDIPESLPHA